MGRFYDIYPVCGLTYPICGIMLSHRIKQHTEPTMTDHTAAAHYAAQADHSADWAELQRLRAVNGELVAVLNDVIRILVAVRYTGGLSKTQLARVDNATTILAKSEAK